MIAYKFRSADQFGFAMDILIKRRLRCSDWAALNDPMEGMFVTSTRNELDPVEQVNAIIKEKKRIKVCALSQTFDCHLLWAHYASGFSGLAVEVDLPEDDQRIRKVTYRGIAAYVPIAGAIDPESVANQVLSSKYSEWSYEREVRVLAHETWYQLDRPIRRVIAGHRMAPAVCDALKIVCERLGIPLFRTGIGDEGIDADNLQPFRLGQSAS